MLNKIINIYKQDNYWYTYFPVSCAWGFQAFNDFWLFDARRESPWLFDLGAEASDIRQLFNAMHGLCTYMQMRFIRIIQFLMHDYNRWIEKDIPSI
jgi:hypothetical protein